MILYSRAPQIKVSDKVMIPQDNHPDINFVGLLIGPRGNTLKNMEKETGAKIIIRGKGSVKEGKVGRKDGQPLPGEDEPLHAYVTATDPEAVKRAVNKIKEVIQQGVEVNLTLYSSIIPIPNLLCRFLKGPMSCERCS